MSMTGYRAVLHLELTRAEEHDMTVGRLLADGQVEESICGRGISDGNLLSGVFNDGSVSEFGHVNVAIRAYEFFERTIVESWSANASGDSNVYEKRRLETSAVFESIESFDELWRRVTPTPVPEGEERDGTVFRHTRSNRPSIIGCVAQDIKPQRILGLHYA